MKSRFLARGSSSFEPNSESIASICCSKPSGASPFGSASSWDNGFPCEKSCRRVVIPIH